MARYGQAFKDKAVTRLLPSESPDFESHIDFGALAAEVDRVALRPLSAQGGRPQYPTETMVRILVLKRLYNLSDEQMEYKLLNRMSYKRFCGLANATTVPDRTTVWTLENRKCEAGAKGLFDGASAQFLKKAFIARCGQIIDATLVPAPKQHNSRGEKALIEQGAMPADWKAAKRRRQDIDATWTKKHGQSYFGYKFSISVDKKYKIIRRIETGKASTHDSQHFDDAFDPSNTNRDLYADRGYPSEGREAWLKDNGFRNQIQRKGNRNKPLSERQQWRNQRIVKTRAPVEHGFGSIEQVGGKLLRTINQARANFAMTTMANCYNLKRLTHFQKAGIEAFWRPKWAESPMPEAIQGKNGATSPKKPVHCRRQLNRIRSL